MFIIQQASLGTELISVYFFKMNYGFHFNESDVFFFLLLTSVVCTMVCVGTHRLEFFASLQLLDFVHAPGAEKLPRPRIAPSSHDPVAWKMVGNMWKQQGVE